MGTTRNDKKTSVKNFSNLSSEVIFYEVVELR